METILIPTDFSPTADNATEYGMNLALFFNSRVVLVHAFPVPLSTIEGGLSLEIDLMQKEETLKRLEETKIAILNKFDRKFDIECVSAMGTPAQVIEDIAKEENADLIVMGIVGEAGVVKKHLIGSVALKIARHQDTPVFIIPEHVKYTRIHKMSFACDMNKTEETDLVYVVKYFSKVFDAEVEIINVEKPKEEIKLEKIMTSLFIENKLETIKHSVTHLEGNDVAKELEDYFDSFPTDVIMVNPKNHNFFHYLFNQSITKELVFHVKSPILTIK